MNFLFVHGNFPAQFKFIVSIIGNNPEHKAVFLTKNSESLKIDIPGVTKELLECHRSSSPETHQYLTTTEEAVINGQAVVRSIEKLVNKGFIPEVIIIHAGMGFGLFLKDILPNTPLIGYFEWYFQAETAHHIFKEYDINQKLLTRTRNLTINEELLICDAAVTPTEWQKNQFPAILKEKINVIFDGIDTNFFFPQKGKSSKSNVTIKDRDNGESFIISGESEIITYATRGMEPIRYFAEFMDSLPKVLENQKNRHVYIAGADRRAYSYNAPTKSGSWKEYCLEKMGNFDGKDRIHFCGLLTYHDYRALIWRSNLHCYLTRPYITSWSLFETASCGAKLGLNRIEATNDIVEDDTYNVIDTSTSNEMSQSIIQALEQPKIAAIKKGYDLKTSLDKWNRLLSNILTSSN